MKGLFLRGGKVILPFQMMHNCVKTSIALEEQFPLKGEKREDHLSHEQPANIQIIREIFKYLHKRKQHFACQFQPVSTLAAAPENREGETLRHHVEPPSLQLGKQPWALH